MKAIDELERACRAVQTAWEDEASALQSEIDDLTAKVAELENEAIDAKDFAEDLYEAICEGRRQDAIDILGNMAGMIFRSVAEQHNLFPDRVPA